MYNNNFFKDLLIIYVWTFGLVDFGNISMGISINWSRNFSMLIVILMTII